MQREEQTVAGRSLPKNVSVYEDNGFFENLLTNRDDKSITCFDNDTCHTDKNTVERRYFAKTLCFCVRFKKNKGSAQRAKIFCCHREEDSPR